MGSGAGLLPFRTKGLFAMTFEKIVSTVDRIAMTGVTAILLAALPLSAVLFVSHSF